MKASGLRSGQYGLFCIVVATFVMALDVADLIRIMPEWTHRCIWPQELEMGGYEEGLFVAMIVSAVLDFVTLLIISVWFGYTPALEPRVRRDAYGTNQFRVHVSRQAFTPARICGLDRRDRLPYVTTLFLVVSFFTQLIILAFHHTFLLVVTLLKIAGLLLLMMRDDLPLPKQTRLRDRSRFGAETYVIKFAAVILAFVFGILFFLQYRETFAAGQQYYRSHQLRNMNDDRLHPDYIYHSWLQNSSRALAAGGDGGGTPSGTPAHVVQIVVDGLRADQMTRNPALRTWLASLAPDVWISDMQCALPTMSAPNWMTLLTGATPEITGLHGNIFDGETEFSTLMSTMSRLSTSESDYPWGMTGCTWWSDMVKSHFPRMGGDGTVSSYSMYDVLRKQQGGLLPIDLRLSLSEQLVRPRYLDFQEFSTLDGQTDDTTDRYRTEVAIQALNHTDFRFFLVHLTNVDTQAHYYGVESPKYNPGDTYQRAVTSSTRYLADILHTAVARRPETVVIITADHGEVDAGGHGGIHPILRQIPFIVYKKGSGISSWNPEKDAQRPSIAGGLGGAQPPTIEDVAPSIAALLDLPVPRQSTGRILPIVHRLTGKKERKNYQDLFEQRQLLVNAFAIQGRYTTLEWCQDLSSQLHRNATWAATASLDELERAIDDLDRLYAKLRDDMFVPLVARNVVLTVFLVAVLIYYVVFLLRKHTLATHRPYYDVWASVGGLALVVVYVVVVLVTVYLVYTLTGYSLWDSTWVHSPSAFLRFVVIALVPGIVTSFVLNRVYHLPFLDWNPLEPLHHQTTDAESCFRGTCLAVGNVFRVLLIETAFQMGFVTDLTWVYFLRLYAFAWTVLLWCILLVLQGTYSFVVPHLFSNFVLTDETWSLRFRVARSESSSDSFILIRS